MSHRTLRPMLSAVLAACCLWLSAGCSTIRPETPQPVDLKPRLEKSLDTWCRWLSTYLRQIPGTDLYTLAPTLGTGNNPYRDVAGNPFAAAAAGYWLKRNNPPEEVARPLRGLIKLVIGTHASIKTIDRPDIQKWGASLSYPDDWHGDLFAVAIGMLLNDSLPPEQHEQLMKILAWEADKQVEFGISKKFGSWPAIWPGGSHGEANAWSATTCQMARVAMPNSPQQEAWRKTAIDYSLNAISIPSDATSDEIVAGKPLKELCKGPNFEPGGIQEHHGFYHPGYEGWPLAYQAFSHVMDQQLPEARRNPDVYLRNWKFVFDRLKQATFSNGRFIYSAGDDWITYGYGNSQFMPATVFAGIHYKDPDAVRMADEWIKLIELQQKISGGSVLGARLAAYQRFHINDFAWYEGQEGCCIAQALWLLERMDEKSKPAPATDKQYNDRNVATYYEPNVRMAWYRDEHTFASIAWRAAFKQWQMLVQPVELPHLLKHNFNGTGMFEVSGVTRALDQEAYKIGTFEKGGFWTTGRIGRESKKVMHGRPNNVVAPLIRQYQAMVVLPGGPTLFVDWCQAQDQLWLLREGSLGLRLAADVFNNHEVKIAAGGAEKSWRPATCRDQWHNLKSRNVTIEKRMTIHALAGDGSFQLLQKIGRSPNRSYMVYPEDPFGADESLLTHELYFGPPAYDDPRIVSPDEWFRKDVLAIYCDPAQTPKQPSGTVSGTFPCIVIDLPDLKCAVAINFGEKTESVATKYGKVEVESQSVKVAK